MQIFVQYSSFLKNIRILVFFKNYSNIYSMNFFPSGVVMEEYQNFKRIQYRINNFGQKFKEYNIE